MGVIGDAQLVGDGQEQRVGRRDGVVLPELLDERIRLGGIAATKDRSRARVDEADLVPVLAGASEIGAIAIVDQRKNAAADRDPRLARMASLAPGGAIGPDLGGLLNV